MAEIDEQTDADIRTVGFINFLLGIWLIITPYWFGYTSSAARANQTWLGIAILILAGLRVLAPRQKWLSFLAGVGGLWAIIAPFILGYNRSVAYWNEVIVGVIIAFLAFSNSSLPAGRQHHHHTHA